MGIGEELVRREKEALEARRQKANDEAREKMAAHMHSAWSGWMIYLFSRCTMNEDGTATIPFWAVQRWKRQMNTAYDDLPEEEKESDRKEADELLGALND